MPQVNDFPWSYHIFFSFSALLLVSFCVGVTLKFSLARKESVKIFSCNLLVG